MDRVFESGAAGVAPSVPASPSSGFASGGDPSGGVPATKPGPYWFHMITEELRKLIVDAGLTPSHTNLSQLSLAVSAIAASGGVASYSGSQVLVAADARKQILFAGAGGNATFTLPASSAVPVGVPIKVKHATAGAFVLTIQRAGADSILAGATSITSFTMLVGDTATLVNTAAGWHLIDGAVTLSYSTGAPVLGASQTRQNVTGSRAFNTNYTNNTPQPIEVRVNLSFPSGSAADLLAGGVVVSRGASGGASNEVPLSAIVLPGEVYRLNNVAGTPSITNWIEIRK